MVKLKAEQTDYKKTVQAQVCVFYHKGTKSVGVGTHRAGLVLQQLEAAPALLQLLVDVQLLLLCSLITLTEIR